MHQAIETNEGKGKPDMICYYNSTKCGVDLPDMKCGIFTTGKKTSYKKGATANTPDLSMTLLRRMFPRHLVSHVAWPALFYDLTPCDIKYPNVAVRLHI
ncbi:hypothetical protein J6590_002862 [Homalodisca vitripennis]|nr:hypothetical protein J6590_002862 [Homalodisca vitripennis]